MTKRKKKKSTRRKKKLFGNSIKILPKFGRKSTFFKNVSKRRAKSDGLKRIAAQGAHFLKTLGL